MAHFCPHEVRSCSSCIVKRISLRSKQIFKFVGKPWNHKVLIKIIWRCFLLSTTGGKWNPFHRLCKGCSPIPSRRDFRRRRWICCRNNRKPRRWTPDHWPLLWWRCGPGSRSGRRRVLASWSGQHGKVQSRETKAVESKEGQNHWGANRQVMWWTGRSDCLSLCRWTVWRRPSPGRTLRRRWTRSNRKLQSWKFHHKCSISGRSVP